MSSFDEIHWILIVDMSNFLNIWIKELRASQGKVRCLWPIYLMTASAGVSTTNAVIRDPDFIFVTRIPSGIYPSKSFFSSTDD